MEAHRVETSRFPHFLDNRLTDGGKVVSLTRRPPFTAPKRFLVCMEPLLGNDSVNTFPRKP
jgi:hypothetical protein